MIGPESGVHDGEFLVALDVVRDAVEGRPRREDAGRSPDSSRQPRRAGVAAAESIGHRPSVRPGRRDRARGEDRALRRAGAGRASDETRRRDRRTACWPTRGRREPRGQPTNTCCDAWPLPADRWTSTISCASPPATRAPWTMCSWRGRCRPMSCVRSIARRRRMLAVPSGRSVPLEYSADGGVAAAVKLQEVFGLAETPRLGPGARARPVLAAGAERPAGPTDPRSSQLLGPHLSGGPEGAARPLPEASVARGSVEREAERPHRNGVDIALGPALYRPSPVGGAS